MIPRTSDVGVIVGRFQVHRLHEAHLALIRSVYDTHPNTVIVLGLSQVKVSSRNPLDFEARKQMLLEAFPKATLLYIKDEPDDHVWSRNLDDLVETIVRPKGTITFYGGRDSFLDHYHGTHQIQVLEPEAYASGTELRKGIARQTKGTEDFRAGVIWASANGWPKVFPTVDIAIWRPVPVAPGAAPSDWCLPEKEPTSHDWCANRNPKEIHCTCSCHKDLKEWLLVRKPRESWWRFCGGFVDPKDESFEMAAKREVAEETGVELGSLDYVGSFQVDDWRYRDEPDKIVTTLFTAPYVFGPVRPADDVAEARWFTTAALDGPDPIIIKEHRPLWAALRRTA